MPIDKAGLSGNKGWLLSNKAGFSLLKGLAHISSPCTSRVVRFKGTAREVQGDLKEVLLLHDDICYLHDISNIHHAILIDISSHLIERSC